MLAVQTALHSALLIVDTNSQADAICNGKCFEPLLCEQAGRGAR
jgi:hypothetical protein